MKPAKSFRYLLWVALALAAAVALVVVNEWARTRAAVSHREPPTASPAALAAASTDPRALLQASHGDSAGTAIAPIDRSSGRESEVATSVFDWLEAELARGNATAGCRLHRELRRCSFIRAQEAELERIISVVANSNGTHASDGLVDLAASIQEGLDQVQGACDGVDDARLDRYFDVVQRSASLRHPLSMVEFANGEAFLGMEYVSQTHRYEAWRRTAIDYAMQALQMGIPEAAFILHLAYSSEVGVLGALIPDDPVEAHALALVLERTVVGYQARPSSQLSADQRDAAVRRANHLYAAHFAQTRPIERLRLGIGNPYESTADACEPN